MEVLGSKCVARKSGDKINIRFGWLNYVGQKMASYFTTDRFAGLARPDIRLQAVPRGDGNWDEFDATQLRMCSYFFESIRKDVLMIPTILMSKILISL